MRLILEIGCFVGLVVLGIAIIMSPSDSEQVFAARSLETALRNGTLQCTTSPIRLQGASHMTILIIPWAPYKALVNAVGAHDVTFSDWHVVAFTQPTLYLPPARIAKNYVERHLDEDEMPRISLLD